MSRILAIETSLGGCSVALSSGECVRATERNQQTSALPQGMQQVLTKANITLAEIDAFAVTRGPGSFTGVRLGLAFMRGLALATGKPILAPTTLELLAYQALKQGITGSVICAINAYRSQVYLQHFTINAAELHAISPPSLEETTTLPAGQHLIGDAGELFPQPAQITTLLPDALPLAHYAGTLPPQDATYAPEPLYLRAPDAKAQKGDLTTCT